jgi:hypothetical protein|nr:MAG TPA: hypothetical protein [Caudoviricetes sp.]DAW56948.1 MAG TPA: hypothetical protein [Caudoviricetes sp.]DAY02276.1 MAG TPA: hypothetical protein [Caudoviricetes sp.]
MENKLQPIHLIAQELAESKIELANYKIAYENLLNENKELKELKELVNSNEQLKALVEKVKNER